jgi:thioredoxin 1
MEKVTSKKHFQTILENHRYVFLDVYAKWCGPCMRIAPEIEILAEQHEDIKFIKMNCDDHKGIAKDLDITTLPTFLLFDEGISIGKVDRADIKKVKNLLRSSRISI